MKHTTELKKRFLVLMTAVLLLQIYSGKEAWADERTIAATEVSVQISREDRKTGGKQVSVSKNRDSLTIFPGEARIINFQLENRSGSSLYCRWAVERESREDTLFSLLRSELTDINGALIYEGTLKDLAGESGPLPDAGREEYVLTLFCPTSVGNEIAGKALSLTLELAFSDNPLFQNGGDSGNAAGSGSGTGFYGERYYKEDGTTGPSDAALRADDQRDAAGNLLIQSRFDRSGAASPASGFAFDRDYIGGGSAKVYEKPDITVAKGIDSGFWLLKDKAKKQWMYCFMDGSYLKSGFALVRNPYSKEVNCFRWYCFDEDGIMMIGWIRQDETCWYHAHETSDGELGALETGWITGSEDGALYYTHERTAVMQSGWIGFLRGDGGYDYSYFARLEDTYRRNWFYSTAIGRWVYDRMGHRSYGSMYVNENTPDQSKVNEKGILEE